MQKYDPTNEYFVEDKMQRKIRIEPLELKRTFYKNLDIFKKPKNFWTIQSMKDIVGQKEKFCIIILLFMITKLTKE